MEKKPVNKGRAVALLPILVFLVLFIGSGILMDDFYAMPTIVAFLIALAVAFFQNPSLKFNEKIVRLRKIKGITQDELASAVGVSRQAVYKWESGQSYPEASKLIEMKALFGISIDDLLDDNYEVIVPDKKKKRLSPLWKSLFAVL